MGAVYVGEFEVGSAAWHQARMGGLGGSEIAAVLGVSPWESTFSLWHRKAGTIPPLEDNHILEAGRRLEPVICQKFADDHPEFAVLPTGTWRNADRPWQIANPDRLLYPASRPLGERIDQAEELFEAKFALYADEWGEPGTDEVPPYYLLQTRWYLDVFGLDLCRLMVFIGSQGEFREYVIRPSEVDTALMRSEAEVFLASVAEDRRPPIDGHDATYRAVRKLHPDIDGTSIDVPAELAATYVRAKRAAAAASAGERAATAELADVMGNAQRAFYSGRLLASRQARGDAPPYVVSARNLCDSDLFTTTDEDTAA